MAMRSSRRLGLHGQSYLCKQVSRVGGVHACHASLTQRHWYAGEYSKKGGRLNLPFVGIATFAKAPHLSDWEELDASITDVAVVGVPLDMGTQYRGGARFGPRSIREGSTLYSFGHDKVYDHESGRDFEYGRIVDLGDVDIIHTDTHQSHENARRAVSHIASRGVFPLILGGDHSITAATVQGFGDAGFENIHVIQFDAHLDFVDERMGVRYGHGNCMKRCSEMPHVSGMTQLGIRGVSSTAREGYEDAIQSNSTILSVRQIRKVGPLAALESVPKNTNYYVTIDIDGFDPSIAPGTGTPSHGGFNYYEVSEMLDLIASKGNIVGLDVTEVAPEYDHSGSTATLAARIALDCLGYVFYHRNRAERG